MDPEPLIIGQMLFAERLAAAAAEALPRYPDTDAEQYIRRVVGELAPEVAMDRPEVEAYLRFQWEYEGLMGCEFDARGAPLYPRVIGHIIRRGRKAGKTGSEIADDIRHYEEQMLTERQVMMFTRIARARKEVSSDDYENARDRLMKRGLPDPDRLAEWDTTTRLEAAKDARTIYQYTRGADDASEDDSRTA